MFYKKKDIESISKVQDEKPIPAFLKKDYSYKAIDDVIIDMNSLKDKEVYEIKCSKCEMSLRSQGKNIRSIYNRIKTNGCVGCGNMDLFVRYVEINT